MFDTGTGPGVLPAPSPAPLGLFRRARGLDAGERALVALVVCREAGRMDLAQDHARTAAEALRDPFAVTLLLEEGLPSPLTGRLGALATAAGALARHQPALGQAELDRLASNGVDADDLLCLVTTVAEASGRLHIAAPERGA
ncbi:hypothetical protein [Celeribacter indicus]|uniref:Uncharacterized protein n=1 Tax=Celeribacter indicus TaxID=1208324 RepID=A0A0B5E1B2_9RHOB|nr:hypothetical protein [Celeribacter indicus]AJE46801.1 hypothetical protein P73_2086 [Celeribacter indicus]SDW81596.1 hypothetical protein SAMN05443573_107174 [Celeribacter indicus]